MKTLARLISASLCVILCGCGSVGSAAKSMGIGRRPLIEYVAPPAFNEKDEAALVRWKIENPDLFKKIQNHNNKNADAIGAYNAAAVKINLIQNALVNDGDEDAAKAAVRVQIQKAKYPAGHPIYGLIGEKEP